MAEKFAERAIAGMEGWAIKVKKAVDSGKYEGAEELLRTINRQGRRVEWRKLPNGIRNLPDLKEVKELKSNIASARAAAQDAYDAVHDIDNLNKKLLQINKEISFKDVKTLRKQVLNLSVEGTITAKERDEIMGINKKIGKNQEKAGKSITIMIQVLKQARAIAEAEPWLNLKNIQDDKKVLESFLRGEDIYEQYSFEERRKIWNAHWESLVSTELTKLNLRNADLRGFNFSNFQIEDINFENATLESAKFYEAKIIRTEFDGANMKNTELIGAQFHRCSFGGMNLEGTKFDDARFYDSVLESSNFKAASFLSVLFSLTSLANSNFNYASFLDATFKEVDFRGATFINADFDSATFRNCENLTAEQLRSAKNVDKVIGSIPLT